MAPCSSPARACSGRRRTATRALAVLREAVASGVNHIDTSDFYGPHVTNQLIREALHPYPRRSGDRDQGRREARRRTLRGTRPSRAGGTDAARCTTTCATWASRRSTWSICASCSASTGRAEGSIEEPLTALAELQRQGLIRHIGLSNVTAAQIAEGARASPPIVCVQNHYNLAHRDDDALIDELAPRRHRLCAVLPARRLHAAAVDGAVGGRRASSAPRRCRWRWPGCCSARPTSC